MQQVTFAQMLYLGPLVIHAQKGDVLSPRIADDDDLHLGRLYSRLLNSLAGVAHAHTAHLTKFMFNPIEAMKASYQEAITDHSSPRNDRPGASVEMSHQLSQDALVDKVTQILDLQRTDSEIKWKKMDELEKRDALIQQKKLFFESWLEKSSPVASYLWQVRVDH